MRFKTLFVSLLALLTVAMGACAPALSQEAVFTGTANAAITVNQGELLEFDVAEDMSRFIFADAPVFEEDGFPAFGNPFITQGYIYPKGTITCNEDGCTGVNPDGSPEFPDQVLGEWTCRGWFVGDGAHTTSGPMVVTTQIYNFGEQFGSAMLVSEGYELADVGIAIERAITGGTGIYGGSRGEISQTFLGWNATEGVSLTYSMKE